jgi:ankyrin repeat protein
MLRTLITNKDYAGIENALSQDPALANEGVPIDETDTRMAHPLHRICDRVFAHACTDQEAVEMARIFLAHGARVDGTELIEKKDTPLVAAASLHAEEVGILYIEHGATIDHPGCNGGTALHWAAWTGRDRLVKRLIQAKADIHRLCIDYKSTPLLWAVLGFKRGGPGNRHHQVECVRLLLAAGADKSVPNSAGKPPVGFLEEGDAELMDLLK